MKQETTHTSVQPWLDYFAMLETYVDKGFLELAPAMNEAYITYPALFTLADTNGLVDDLKGTLRGKERKYTNYQLWRNTREVVRRIQIYANYIKAIRTGLEQANEMKLSVSSDKRIFMEEAFAVHVVEHFAPHDLLLTILLTPRRRWWSFWKISTHYEIIKYSES